MQTEIETAWVDIKHWQEKQCHPIMLQYDVFFPNMQKSELGYNGNFRVSASNGWTDCYLLNIYYMPDTVLSAWHDHIWCSQQPYTRSTIIIPFRRWQLRLIRFQNVVSGPIASEEAELGFKPSASESRAFPLILIHRANNYNTCQGPGCRPGPGPEEAFPAPQWNAEKKGNVAFSWN